jgi:hypothetical protein
MHLLGKLATRRVQMLEVFRQYSETPLTFAEAKLIFRLSSFLEIC